MYIPPLFQHPYLSFIFRPMCIYHRRILYIHLYVYSIHDTWLTLLFNVYENVILFIYTYIYTNCFHYIFRVFVVYRPNMKISNNIQYYSNN